MSRKEIAEELSLYKKFMNNYKKLTDYENKENWQVEQKNVAIKSDEEIYNYEKNPESKVKDNVLVRVRKIVKK